MSDDRLLYKVVGPNTRDGRLEVWNFPTLKTANEFAKQLARDTDVAVQVVKVIGVWQIEPNPVGWRKPAEETSETADQDAVR